MVHMIDKKLNDFLTLARSIIKQKFHFQKQTYNIMDSTMDYKTQDIHQYHAEHYGVDNVKHIRCMAAQMTASKENP